MSCKSSKRVRVGKTLFWTSCSGPDGWHWAKQVPTQTHTDCCQVTQARHKTVAAGCTGNSQFPLCYQLLPHLFRHMKCSIDGQTVLSVHEPLIVLPVCMHRLKDLRLKAARKLTDTTGRHNGGHSSRLFTGWRYRLHRRIMCIWQWTKIVLLNKQHRFRLASFSLKHELLDKRITAWSTPAGGLPG